MISLTRLFGTKFSNKSAPICSTIFLRNATALQFKSMLEMAKAMGDNDEAARVMRMMKDYNRAHPPEASSSVSTASSLVPTEVQTLSSLLQLRQLQQLKLL
jgi:hypothetical protein